ncbi:hypothetical protein, partial [Cognatilysobacter lacus]|uniref:hypothetical protein n=1 Tax=Cognatilysobacter lacus TaxID=1643323 RepID=UPI00195F6783
RGLAMSEVLDGLRAGDRVIAAGALEPATMPKDGARVRVEGQPLPEASRATRRELPVKFD